MTPHFVPNVTDSYVLNPDVQIRRDVAMQLIAAGVSSDLIVERAQSIVSFILVDEKKADKEKQVSWMKAYSKDAQLPGIFSELVGFCSDKKIVQLTFVPIGTKSMSDPLGIEGYVGAICEAK